MTTMTPDDDVMSSKICYFRIAENSITRFRTLPGEGDRERGPLQSREGRESEPLESLAWGGVTNEPWRRGPSPRKR